MCVSATNRLNPLPERPDREAQMDTFELLLKRYIFRPLISLEEAGSPWGHTAKTMTE
jgi:hypothetical protein